MLHLGITLARRLDDPTLEETLLRTIAVQPAARPTDIAAYASFLVRTGREAGFKRLLTWAAERGAMPEGDLRVETGQVLVREGYYGAALETVRPMKRDPRALPVRARAYVSLGDDRKALDCYRRIPPSPSRTWKSGSATAPAGSRPWSTLGRRGSTPPVRSWPRACATLCSAIRTRRSL